MASSRPQSQRHAPLSAIEAFIDHGRIDALLARLVPDVQDRAFVVRCILEEGPAHHRGANFILLSLLGLLLEKHSAALAVPAADSSVAVPLRLPPHLLAVNEDGHFPLRMPTNVIERLAPKGSREHDAMVDCLTDGPPQHALANAITICLLGALLERPAS